jgi:hypothetical protein
MAFSYRAVAGLNKGGLPVFASPTDYRNGLQYRYIIPCFMEYFKKCPLRTGDDFKGCLVCFHIAEGCICLNQVPLFFIPAHYDAGFNCVSLPGHYNHMRHNPFLIVN